MSAMPGQLSAFQCTNEYMSDKDWRCGRYGPMGLIESILMLGGMGASFASIQLYDPDENRVPRLSLAKIAMIATLGVLSAIQTVLIVQRVMEKELCALMMKVFSTAAHWFMFLILFTSGDPSEFVFVFAVLFMWANYAKLGFLYLEDEFETHLLDRSRLFMLTGIETFLYLGILGLQVVIWILDYPVVS